MDFVKNGIELIFNSESLQSNSRRTRGGYVRNHRFQKKPSPNRNLANPALVYTPSKSASISLSQLSQVHRKSAIS